MILPLEDPPDDVRRRPLVVRYLLGNVRTRRAAVWLVVATAGFVLVALALQDPILVGIAIAGVVAYLWSIRWMDRHDGWTSLTEPPGVVASVLGREAPLAGPSSAGATHPVPPDAVDASTRPLAIEGLRSASFGGSAGAAAGETLAPPRAGVIARVFAALVVVATITFIGSLYALEADGDPPTGGHLVEVMLDALFGLGFGAFGVIVILRRQRLPGGRVLSVVASAGLGLVAGLGYFVAGGLGAVNPGGPGMLAAWLIAAAAAGAGVWLTATSGARMALLLAIPAVLVGWYLGFAFWIAHVNAV